MAWRRAALSFLALAGPPFNPPRRAVSDHSAGVTDATRAFPRAIACGFLRFAITKSLYKVYSSQAVLDKITMLDKTHLVKHNRYRKKVPMIPFWPTAIFWFWLAMQGFPYTPPQPPPAPHTPVVAPVGHRR
jgi:hypothetical protein